MQNTLFTNDNLFVLHGMNSELVDLIYIDPPFNSKRMYSAPVGSKAAGSSFKDMWVWQDVNEAYLEKLIEKYPSMVRFIQSIQEIHSKAMMAYCLYMAQRIIEMHRILKETGSFYLHCDPTASHYLKVILDEIFGKNNFRNEIVWIYRQGGRSDKMFSKKHDIILTYGKNNKKTFFNADNVRIPYEGTGGYISRGYNIVNGKKYEVNKLGKIPEDWWDIPALNPNDPERTGYPTQKPLALLERIIKSSCPENGIVLDAFCGCATTCVAARNLKRQWIGIDIAEKSVEILLDRLDNLGEFAKSNKQNLDFIHRTDVPQRTDIQIEPITKNTKQTLFDEQKGNCNGCGKYFDIYNFEIDHIIPKAKGGSDYYENYQLLCGNCNKTKGDRPMEYLRMKIKVREEIIAHKLTFGE